MRPVIVLHIPKSYRQRCGMQRMQNAHILKKKNNLLQGTAVSDDRWFFCTEKELI